MITTSPKSRTEVITSVQRRRKWSLEEKQRLIEETYQQGQSISSVARQNGMAPSQLFYWRRCMENGAMTAVENEEQVIPQSELKKAQLRIRELERLVGKQTLQIEIFKEAVKLGREKKLISRAPLLGIEDFQ